MRVEGEKEPIILSLEVKSIGLISVQFSQSHLVAVVFGQRVPEQDEPVQQPDGVALSQRASRSLRQLRPTKFRPLLPGKIANQVQTLERVHLNFVFSLLCPFRNAVTIS